MLDSYPYILRRPSNHLGSFPSFPKSHLLEKIPGCVFRKVAQTSWDVSGNLSEHSCQIVRTSGVFINLSGKSLEFYEAFSYFLGDSFLGRSHSSIDLLGKSYKPVGTFMNFLEALKTGEEFAKL